jgi:hypothetical protein
MSVLYDVDNNLITDLVNLVLPHFDAIKIKNRLLNGTYHIQTIGTPVKLMDIECTVSEDGKEAIDNIEALSSPIKLTKEGRYYLGLISDTPQCDPILKANRATRQYSCKFTLSVNEEGVEG